MRIHGKIDVLRLISYAQRELKQRITAHRLLVRWYITKSNC